MQPKITLSNSRPFEETTDALVLFVPEKGAFDAFTSVNSRAKNALSKLIQEEHFKAKVGECILFHSPGMASRRIILAGVGKKEECTPETIRRAASSAANVARNASCSRISYTLLSGVGFKTDQAIEAIVSGALLGTYRFLKFKTREEDQEQDKKIENI
ncbi:MAG TPA: M17 family peptidase N-terminal domain-containing protein, partial [Acidobacteriota bacterium]|nr:M17 family peptidase N-terminal domain-containing protein [Acidobacteriota bacterium]